MNTAKQLKDELIKMIAIDRVYDQYAGSARDETTVEEMQESVLELLEKAGFTEVRQELKQGMDAVEKEDFSSDEE
jgi:predicted methyltransferase